MSGVGGTVITTVSFSHMAGGIIGIGAGGIRLGGYDPGANYAYDGPIYAYNDLSPDQVVANVQAAFATAGLLSRRR
jgi:hypothetical protein